MTTPNLDIIKDPVTGSSYARDLNIQGSTYAPYTAPTVPVAPVASATQTPTIQSIQQGLNDLLKGLGGTSNPQTGQMNITAEQLTNAVQPKPINITTPPSTLGTRANAMVAGVQERLKAEEALKQKRSSLMPPSAIVRIKND